MSLSKSHPEPQGFRPARKPEPDGATTIGEMSRTFKVSLRTLRFYEDRGLLVPRREGTTRYYGNREKARLELILQGKQLGFTLTEIREMLAASDKKTPLKRLELKPEQILAQIAHLEQQKSDIDGAINQLRHAQKLLVKG
jgi:DNA-binding transcriptional MerR regulator